MPFKMDTKQILFDALYQLIQEKPIESITVQDILDRSGASRTTFYRYFQDKFELMCWFYEDFVRRTFEEVYTQQKTWRETLHYYAEFYMQHKTYFINAFQYNGQNSFDAFLYKYCLEHFTKMAKVKSHTDILPKEMIFAIKMYCYGNSALVRDWLNGELDLTVDEFCAYRYNAIPQIMKDFLD